MVTKQFLNSEEILGFILDVPTQGIRSVEGCKPSTNYVLRASKYENINFAEVVKKFHKGEHQLYFNFVYKVVLPQTEQRTVASIIDLLKAKSQVSDLLEKHESLKREMEDFIAILGDKKVEITCLKALLQHANPKDRVPVLMEGRK
ncbi:hypothetical protein KY290_008008 [Solanum tuberosum]|uniref:Uncharacterized protein n=1 Tax=Solanum tuberosum TaxID=4113 RepID=A0ABQ7W9W0_SOLTU|nr:hypothetical protein KY290_008008 [Solanum tuberosum]